MDANKLPKFYPRQIVIFKMGSDTNLGLGKIKAGLFQGDKWQYKIKSPSSAGQDYIYVHEENILRKLEGANWTSA